MSCSQTGFQSAFDSFFLQCLGKEYLIKFELLTVKIIFLSMVSQHLIQIYDLLIDEGASISGSSEKIVSKGLVSKEQLVWRKKIIGRKRSPALILDTFLHKNLSLNLHTTIFFSAVFVQKGFKNVFFFWYKLNLFLRKNIYFTFGAKAIFFYQKTGTMQLGDSPDMCEYPFLTMTKFSPGFLSHLGGMVSAKSVKVSSAGQSSQLAQLIN